jgi:hypothetical protein
MRRLKVENGLAPPRKSERRFIASLTTAIVASVIVGIFFQPIISFTSGVVTSLISIFYQGWLDHIYRQAAGSALFNAIYFIFFDITVLPIAVISIIMITRFLGTETSLISDRLRGILTIPIMRRVSIIWIVLAIPVTFIVTSEVYTAFQARATFDQRLMALEPVISEQERKSLLAQWALMKGRVDYEKINKRLEELAEKYHAELPSPYI